MTLLWAYTGKGRDLIKSWYRDRIITPSGQRQSAVDAELVNGLRADLAKRRNN